MHRFWLVLALIVFPLVSKAVAEGGPRVSIKTMAELATPLPLPYDDKADANARVAEAFAKAKRNGKRVLLDFGGNWCPDCRVFAGVLQLPEVKAYLDRHYEIVSVDVGRFNQNLELVHRYGITKLAGVPTVVIANADGTPLNVSNAAELESARSMTPQAIADWLARWAK